MTLIFSFKNQIDPEETLERAKELNEVVKNTVDNHFKGKAEVLSSQSEEFGYFTQVDLPAEVFINDLEKAKNAMYKEGLHYIEDFISDVQEYCSYGGIVVTARG